MTIRAEAHSDDMAVAIRFDAEKWFEQASDQEILDLAKCGKSDPVEWGGDYPGDAVALYMQDYNPNVAELFSYINIIQRTGRKDAPGFECYVYSGDAGAWIMANRPHLHDAVIEILDQFPIKERDTPWDRDQKWRGDYKNNFNPSL